MDDGVTDELLGEICRFTTVKGLGIGGANITDSGMQRLAALKHLEVLRLRATKATDAGLEYLACQRTLRILDLNAPITDRSGKVLRRFENLEELGLYRDRVSDKCIDDICSLRRLKRLEVYRTRITKSGLKELGARLPGCMILPEADSADGE